MRRRPIPASTPADQAQLARVLRAGLAVDPAGDRGQRVGSSRACATLGQARPADGCRRAAGGRGRRRERGCGGRSRRDARRDGATARRQRRGRRSAGRPGGHVDERGRPHDRRVPGGSAAATAATRPARSCCRRGVPARRGGAPPGRVAVGEAKLVDGVYAAPSSTTSSVSGRWPRPGCDGHLEADRRAAGRPGRSDVSIVPLGRGRGSQRCPTARRSSALTRPGAESRAGAAPGAEDHAAPTRPRSRRDSAHEHGRADGGAPPRPSSTPTTLVPLTVAGFALIYPPRPVPRARARRAGDGRARARARRRRQLRSCCAGRDGDRHPDDTHR